MQYEKMKSQEDRLVQQQQQQRQQLAQPQQTPWGNRGMLPPDLNALILAMELTDSLAQRLEYVPDLADRLAPALAQLNQHIFPLILGPAGKPCKRCGGTGREKTAAQGS